MKRFLLFSLGIALVLLCQGLMKSDEDHQFPPDDYSNKQDDDFYNWMLIYGPIMITFFSLVIAIVAYAHELNMMLHLAPVVFLLIMISIFQYCILFVFTSRALGLRTACSYFLAGIMAIVAIVTPFYASWAANTGCCAKRVVKRVAKPGSQQRQQKECVARTFPDFPQGVSTIQESAALPVRGVRLPQIQSASISSSSFDAPSPEREAIVLIHSVPKSPSSSSNNEVYSPKSSSYAPLGAASTPSSHQSEFLLGSVPASSDDCSPMDPGTLARQTPPWG